MRHNQDKIALKINNLKLAGVDAVGDDGSVCIQVAGNQDRVVQVAKIIMNKVGDVDTTDGVQTGGLWINADDCNIHDDLFRVSNLD